MTTYSDYSGTLAPNARAIFADLCGQLPKSADDTEEAIAAHARKAMDAVFALRPEDAFEALLATRIVAMDAHAADALRSAALAAGAPEEINRCRRQAASMARQSDSALRTLRRMQAERDKAFNEGHPATMGRAGYWFREVSVPAPAEPAPWLDPGDPGPAAPPATEPDPQPTPADIEADAKLYAAMYPDRVRRIRVAGGLPADLDFGPPEREIMDALLRGAGGASAVPPHGTRPYGAGH
jgi:hypothetical protein